MWTLTKEQNEIAERGKKILNKHNMLYLALYPRSGKTLITMQIIKDTYVSPQVLWVTPKSAIEGIHKVYDKMQMGFDLTVINYESLHKVEEDVYNVICIDESHSKISKFPKPSRAYKELRRIINGKQNIIWLSGTPKIESNSKLFHQIALSPWHPWHQYKNFYKWHSEYGIKGLTIWTGGPRPSIDYSQTVDLTKSIDYFLIKDARTAIDAFKLHKVYVTPPKEIKSLYRDMNIHRIITWEGHTAIADNGGTKLIKLLQITGGTFIDDEDTPVIVSDYKAKMIWNKLGHKNVCVFYKFTAEKLMLMEYFEEKDLYQIDATSCGVDLSHYEAAAVLTPTFSGSNFTQCLNRLSNQSRKDIPEIYLFQTRTGADKQAIDDVLTKYDHNLKFLEGE